MYEFECFRCECLVYYNDDIICNAICQNCYLNYVKENLDEFYGIPINHIERDITRLYNEFKRMQFTDDFVSDADIMGQTVDLMETKGYPYCETLGPSVQIGAIKNGSDRPSNDGR